MFCNLMGKSRKISIILLEVVISGGETGRIRRDFNFQYCMFLHCLSFKTMSMQFPFVMGKNHF